jgi:hypothetical protein
MVTQKKPGRPPDTGEARSAYIKVRATPDEALQFDAVGGAAWLRRALKRAYARLKEGKPPASG